MMPTPFMALRELGLSVATGYAMNALTAVVAALVVGWCYRARSIEQDLRIVIFSIATFFASPYAFNYDLTIVTAALIGLLAFRDVERLRAGELLAIMGVWILPILLPMRLVTSVAIPYGPLCLGTMLAYLVVRANLRVDLGGAQGRATRVSGATSRRTSV
jgi:hypothetical protein